MSQPIKPAVLVISGLDPQGCAGLAADIKTLDNHGVHAVPLVTCLTEQTSQGLTQLGALSAPQFMANYTSCVADFTLSAIKIGLIPSIDIAHCIINILKQHTVPVVFDPVLASTSGGKSLDTKLIQFIATHLLPKTTLLTPNAPELKLLTGSNDISAASQQLINQGVNACLITGGHSTDEWATDYYVTAQDSFYLYQKKHPKSVRGTGCCLASSITAQLACKQEMRDAIVLAKHYVSRGIRLAHTVGTYLTLKQGTEDIQLEDMPKLCYQHAMIGQPISFATCPDRLGIYPLVNHENWVKKLLSEGIQTIQLRIKNLSPDERLSHIKHAVNHAKRYNNIALFINDYWEEAIKATAYGVHLGQDDLQEANLLKIANAGLRLGISTHSYWELSRALAINPSYIAFGPIFKTTSKNIPFSPQGIKRLSLWAKLLSGHYPLVAIGSIDLDRVKQLKPTGVGSVAMISAITHANDYRKVTHDLLKYWG